MARKTATITISDEGRDRGKTFILREMSAYQAERWAMRALLALARSGFDVPDNFMSLGLAGIAAIGMRALGGMSFEDAEPLLNEMMDCVMIVPDPARPQVSRALVEDDIEEVATRLKLRMEVFNLHTSFLQAVARSTSAAAAQNQTAG